MTLQPQNYDRDVVNVAYQCMLMRKTFDLMDNSSEDGSYRKYRVNVDVHDAPKPGRAGRADSKTHFEVWAEGSYYETPRHEYTHCVVYDLYGSSNGVGDSAEENAMDEAFAMYFAARAVSDWNYETWQSKRDMEDPDRWHDSQHVDSNDREERYPNGMILASTLWDVVQGGLSTGNDYATPPPVLSPTGWDEIVFLTLASEKKTFWEFRNRLVEMAGAWGGSSYANFAAA